MSVPFHIPRRGLRFKIIAWAFVPVALLLLAVGLWNLWSFYAITQALIIENNRSTTQLMAGRLIGQLDPFTGELETLAREIGLAGTDLAARRSALENSSTSLDVFDAGLVLLDRQGIVEATVPERTDVMGQNRSDRPYVRQLVSSRGAILSDITRDGIDGSNAIALAVPVLDTMGEPVGTLAGMFRVDAKSASPFYNVLSTFVTWQDANYLIGRGPLMGGFFVDHNGLVIYHSDPSQIGRDLSARGDVQLALGGKAGPISTREFQLAGPVSYFSPVPGTSWALVLEQAPDAVLSFYWRYFLVQSTLFALAIVIPAVFVVFAARRVTNPIGKLIAATHEVAKGNLSQRVSLRTRDELEDLAGQFNLMSGKLKESYSALEAREERLAELVQAANRQNAYLGALYETTLGIVSRLDTTDLLETIVERATKLVDSFYGWVYLVTPDKDALEVRVGTGYFHRYIGLRLKRGDGLAGAIWQNGEPIVVEDYQTWSGRSSHFADDPVGPGMGVPLKSGSEVIGVIGLTRPPGSAPFNRDELDLMTRFAQLASIALENARLHTSLQGELAIEAGQRQFLELLARGGDFSETLHALVRIIEGQWPGMLGLILLLDEDGRHLHIGASVSLPKEYADSIEGLEIGPMVGSCGTACYRRERVIVEDIASDPRWEGLRDLGLRYGLRACWSEPVFSAAGDVAGTFAMYYRQPRAPSPAELETIQTAAHLVGIAVEQQRAQRARQSAYEILEQKVEERTHELATLNAIANAVNRSLELEEVLNDALEKTMQAVDMEFGGAYRLDGEEDSAPEARSTATPDAPYTLTPLVFRGFSEESLRAALDLQLPWNAIAIPAGIGEPFAYMVEGAVMDAAMQRLLDREHIRQIITIPLVCKSRIVGILNLATANPRTFTPEQLSLLSSIGQQVGIAVENARLYGQARESALLSERSRLARELHDSVTQSLYSVTLYTEAAARLLKSGKGEEAARHLRDVRQTAQEALREMRLLIFQLRPPVLETNTLAAALQARLDAVESRGGMQATLHVHGEERLGRIVQEELYHIAQEALNNALKHARAQHVQVELRFEPMMTHLEVCDDGAGFEPEVARLGSGFGIAGMRERTAKIGGSISIGSVPGKGTRVTVQVPVQWSLEGGAR